MNIADILREQAAARPDAPAIVDAPRGRERVTTFAALDDQVARAAALLWESGLRPGDRVLVLQPMSADLYVALIALFRLGLVAMFVDPSAGMDHIGRCCALYPPSAFVGSPKAHLLRLLVPALRRVPRKFVIGPPLPGAVPWSRSRTRVPHETSHTIGPDAPALLTFTSGSTGQPKAALRTHAFLLAQHRVLDHTFPAPAGAVSLTTLPIFVLADLASGVTSLIAAGDLRRPARVEAGPILAQIERWRPVRAGASPAFWERIVAHCRVQGATLPGLRTLYAGGAPVFPRLLEELHAIAPDAEIVAVYGSTEAEPIAHIARSELLTGDVEAMREGRGLLAGCPVQEIALRVLPDRWGTPIGPYAAHEFDTLCLTADEPGEVVVSGEHVLPGYVDGRGDEETKFRVDATVWHRTGDAGYLDERGRLWLLGRCAARIEDERGTLYPFVVETAVSFDPHIRRSAIVAHARQRLLAVELDVSPTPEALAAIERLAAWADLDAVRAFPHLPVDRRHNAKIDYPALRRLLDASAGPTAARPTATRPTAARP
jgi:acyl-CoA synthetase (AMP-forming)/AMP-acid ligase II